jgi:two-component system, LytTR family, response regulator
MIRCLVVDDEAIARQHLLRLIAAHPDLEAIGNAANGVEALQSISEHHPDVVFLDIEMPGLTGFDMLAQLSRPPFVVFVTAYDKYAVRAFEASAVDYLLKPVEPARFAKAAERLRAAFAKPREEYEALLRNALAALRPGAPAKLAARRGRRIVLLSPHDILYASIEDKIVFFHVRGERYATDRTIAELEQLLAPAGFCRISRSVVVNLSHARELLPWSSGTWKLRLADNSELDVSRERARELKSQIG